MSDDRSYHLQRAMAEEERAREAKLPCPAAAHAQLAATHHVRAEMRAADDGRRHA